MKKKFSEVDLIIGRDDLIEKWIQDRKKEKTQLNIKDIYLIEKIHRNKFHSNWIPADIKEVKGTIIVTPFRGREGKYVLVRGWLLYHFARVINQEKINVYITRSNRDRFAQKLLRYEEKVNKE